MDARVRAIHDEANIILGQHCIKKYGAFCCKNYSLVLSDDEIKIVVGEKEKALHETGKFKPRMGGGWLLNINGGCPALNKNNHCTVYNNRPSICKNAPFVFDEELKIVKVGCGCSAITSGILNSFFTRFEEAGWKVYLATDDDGFATTLKRWKN